MNNFLIVAGGTGGHLAPAIALAQKLNANNKNCSLVVSKKNVDKLLLKKYPKLKFYECSGSHFSMKISKLFTFAKSQIKGIFDGLKIIKKENIQCVICFGGFMSLGVCIAAKIKRVPIVLHEANQIPGKAIKTLSKIATKVFLPKGVILENTPKEKIAYCGYPVRKEIFKMDKQEAKKRLNVSQKKLILVFGGSQGAKTINDWAYDNLSFFEENNLNLICICGANKLRADVPSKIEIKQKDISFTFIEFCQNMNEALNGADIVIARAGAGSIAEIARCSTPAIFMPFPNSANNHQLENAKAIEKAGAGILVEDKNISSLNLEISHLIENDWLMQKLCDSLNQIDKSNNFDLLFDYLISL